MRIRLTVHLDFDVDDGTDIDLLCLELADAAIDLIDANTGEQVDAGLLEYETIDAKQLPPAEEDLDDE